MAAPAWWRNQQIIRRQRGGELVVPAHDVGVQVTGVPLVVMDAAPGAAQTAPSVAARKAVVLVAVAGGPTVLDGVVMTLWGAVVATVVGVVLAGVAGVVLAGVVRALAG